MVLVTVESADFWQIARQFAECIYLGEGTRVQVRALANVAKASLVTIEPNSEDDWEVLELNSELAEAAILKQVQRNVILSLLLFLFCQIQK